jgi:glycerophosphoryl diester phosphodiesterase
MGVEILQPIIFGHRGACGYRPENTMESFELAILQGADGVECDLVPTRDGELIIRHENWLNGTTNIAEVAKFASRQRTGYSDGLQETGWFSEDFDWSELASVRARERVPDIRPGSAKFDGQFQIPVIDDLLAASFMDNKKLVIEIKHGMHFTRSGIDVAGILARKLALSDWKSRGIEITIESFDLAMMQLLKEACGNDKKYVFLTEQLRLPDGADRLSASYLAQIAKDFDGISVDLPLVLDADSSGSHCVPNDAILMARSAGLLIYGWTLRAEDAPGNVDEYFAKVAMAGLDGIFVDQPDLLRQIVDGSA